MTPFTLPGRPPRVDGLRIVVPGRIVGEHPVADLREQRRQVDDARVVVRLELDEVRRIERIPVLGTGKTDYTSLRRLLTEA